MKYLTKEWYKQMNLTDLHYDLKVLDEVATKDEALYERLRAEREQEYVDLQEELYDLEPDEISLMWPEGWEDDLREEGLTEEEIEAARPTAEELAEHERLLKEFEERPPFDREEAKAFFKTNSEFMTGYFEEILPEHIQAKIADMRVFALDYVTQEVYDLLEAEGEKNREETEAVLDEFEKVEEAQKIPQHIQANYNMHDAVVLTQQMVGNDLVLTFDVSGGFTDLNKVTYKDAEIVESEPITGESWYLYDEIYRTETGYEVHMLLQDEELLYLTVRCSDIICEEEEE